MSVLNQTTNGFEPLTASAEPHNSSLPGCPYTIQLLYTNSTSSTYLIREHDEFGEFPNIYAKVYYKQPTRLPIVIVLSDSGTGLDVKNEAIVCHGKNDPQNRQIPSSSTRYWNIETFLASALNPGHVAPYVVLTTHCHYDHICGIQHLLNAKVNITVLASSYDKDFLTPWRTLQKHSLCPLIGLEAPKYDAHWIEDAQKITITGLSHLQNRFQTSITVIHTPGHTPDSVSWYDSDSYTLCVGDMFYEKESDETRSGSGGHWPREPPQPVIFTHESSIIDWNASMHRLLDYVRYLNRTMGTGASQPTVPYRQDGLGSIVGFEERSTSEEDWSIIETIPSRRRVALCASHVTIGTDAEFALSDMLAFMLRIQLDQVPRKRVHDIQNDRDAWLWDDALAPQYAKPEQNDKVQCCQFSIKAPWSVIHRTA